MKKFTLASMLAAAVLTAGPVVSSFAQNAPDTAAAPAAPTSPETASAPAESAEGMLAAFDAAKPPAFDRAKQNDMAYRQEFNKLMVETMQKRAELAKTFVEKYPDHARAGEMLNQHLQATARTAGADASCKTIADFLAKHPDTAAKNDLLFASAAIATQLGGTYEQALAAIDTFDKAMPNDPRTAQLKGMAIEQGNGLSPEAKTAAMKQFIADNKDNPVAQRMAGKLAKAEKVGKPFELKFTDAVSGKEISMASLKGKVVVIDFWATWCGPCVAEMPKNKEIYAQYKDKGVEFIGVSLDQAEAQGGKKALLAFVEKNAITWPQYYQGNFWDSEFSKSWGIDSIPAVFIVDSEGNLYSTEARGQLEKMIPELIAKRDAAAKS